MLPVFTNEVKCSLWHTLHHLSITLICVNRLIQRTACLTCSRRKIMHEIVSGYGLQAWFNVENQKVSNAPDFNSPRLRNHDVFAGP